MTQDSSEVNNTASKLRRIMESEGDQISKNVTRLNDQRNQSVAEMGDEYEPTRKKARQYKETAIQNLPSLIDTIIESVEENGGSVYVAEDATDANEYIKTISAKVGADSVVKSKSMTTEEIGVNDALGEIGVDAHETDLGELVIQIANEKPSHLIGPSLHKSREEIAKLFNEKLNPDQSLESAEELTDFARNYVGERIEEADIGMTGANFVIAETGSIVLITNEGNARKVVESTNTHIAVAGIEKLLPSLSELDPFLKLVGRSGAGQTLTAYTTILTPPIATPPVSGREDSEDSREFHLVLIDNGRMEMRDDVHLRETLYCVRCGACANTCPVFQQVGGHAFGGETYTGGIATGWEAGIEGLDTAGEFNDLCTGCTQCLEDCPVKIDIPWINTVIRDRINRKGDEPASWLVDGLVPDEESEGIPIQKRLFGNIETVARIASATAPISNKLADTSISRHIMEKLFGVDHRRELPEFSRTTFVEWFENRGSQVANPINKAVIYPDLYTNYVRVDQGKAAVRVLEALNVEVVVPEIPSSGRAPLSQGMIATATEQATEVTQTLDPFIEKGWDVVVIEPSDHAMFSQDYERLVPETPFNKLANNSYDIFEYIHEQVKVEPENVFELDNNKEIFYHSHCQQRTLGQEKYTISVLEALGFDVKSSNAECCGMAGSFGYKSDYYELSIDIGDKLKNQIEKDVGSDHKIIASGTSCNQQMDTMLNRQTEHPIELLSSLL